MPILIHRSCTLARPYDIDLPESLISWEPRLPSHRELDELVEADVDNDGTGQGVFVNREPTILAALEDARVFASTLVEQLDEIGSDASNADSDMKAILLLLYGKNWERSYAEIVKVSRGYLCTQLAKSKRAETWCIRNAETWKLLNVLVWLTKVHGKEFEWTTEKAVKRPGADGPDAAMKLRSASDTGPHESLE